MRVLLFLPLLLLCENAAASTIQFNIVRGKCDGTGLFSSCDDSARGGICAYAADANRSWCCPPGEALCGSWGQSCSGAGNLAGTGQLFCQSGDTRWCCNAQYEVCIKGPAINLCRTKFDNPYANISDAAALSLQSEFFATSTVSSKTSSPTSSISQGITSSATTTSSSTTTSSPTSTSSPTATLLQGSTLSQTTSGITPTPSSSISGGAIAGIVIGALAGIALIAAGGFFLGRKYMRNATNSPQMTPKYAADVPEGMNKDSAFGRSELHNASVPYDPYQGSGHQRSELP